MVKINWKLYNKGKKIIDLKNIECEYNKNILTIKLNDGTNIIDLNKKKFIRKNENCDMTIDFINKIVKFKLDDNRVLDFDLNCNMDITNEKIIINYKIDEEMQIIVERI